MDDKGVVRFWFKTGDLFSQERRRFICNTLIDIDERHSKLDREQGKPRVFSKERQAEKRAFANLLTDENEKKFAHDWITHQ